jgi:hypothetical protein
MEIVTAGEDNKTYLAEFEGDGAALKRHLDANNDWVELHNVWELTTVRQHQVDQHGRILAETRLHLLMPIDMVVGPMKLLNIRVASWYDVDADPESRGRIDELKNSAMAALEMERAKKSGILTPDSGIRPVSRLPGLREALKEKR